MLKTLNTARRAQSGMAAVEFAMVLPAMLALVFGAIEVSNALICKANVTNTASTAADLVGQETQVTDADLNDVYASLERGTLSVSIFGDADQDHQHRR